MPARKVWITFLILWLAAFPAAVVVGFFAQSVHGVPHVLLGLVRYVLTVWVLGGWIPVVVARPKKQS